MPETKPTKQRSKQDWLTLQEYIDSWSREHRAEEKMTGETTFFEKWLAFGYKGGRILARLGLTPNHVSILAILTSLLSALIIIITGLILEPVTPSLLVPLQVTWPLGFLPPMGFLGGMGYDAFKPQIFLAALLLVLAFALLLLSGFLDVLDGAVARLTKSQSSWGSYYEQVLDKFADAMLVIALIMARIIDVFWGVLALLGFIMVDYARARHQADGLMPVKVTLGERPFRMLFLATAAGMQVMSYLAIVFNVVIPITPVFYVHQLTMEAIRYFTFLLVLLTHISVIQISRHAKKFMTK